MAFGNVSLPPQLMSRRDPSHPKMCPRFGVLCRSVLYFSRYVSLLDNMVHSAFMQSVYYSQYNVDGSVAVMLFPSVPSNITFFQYNHLLITTTATTLLQYRI